MNQRLVILTTSFGTNYSGGSTATCEIFSRLQSEFRAITVIGCELGEHPFTDVQFIKAMDLAQVTRVLRTLTREDTIFYGDFYNAIAYVHAGLPFYFTYHDNWPEIGGLLEEEGAIDRWHWRAYQTIFRTANHVFCVSEFKKYQVLHYTNRVSVVRNGIADLGFNAGRSEATVSGGIVNGRSHIVMAGSIDSRKYVKALAVFDQLTSTFDDQCFPFQVDIYGRCQNAELGAQLEGYPFVNLKGYVRQVPFHQYVLCLHTSLMENLSLTWCESIASGTPVLSFDVGGAAEVITENRGYLVPAYDIDAMCRQLLVALSEPLSVEADDLRQVYSWDLAASGYRERLTDAG